MGGACGCCIPQYCHKKRSYLTIEMNQGRERDVAARNVSVKSESIA